MKRRSKQPDPAPETVRIELHSNSAEQTQEIADMLAKRLQPGDVVALEGELGAGKTVFVRGLAGGLTLDPRAVSSPTFVIRQEYAAAGKPTLVHIDAYRLQSKDDLETIGWSELLEDDDVIIAVEWPSRIAAALPANRIDVSIQHTDSTTRTITITAPPTLADRLQNLQPSQQVHTAKCRKCGTIISANAPTFPFCSPRCRLADLGAWFNEGYRVSREMKDDDELDV